MGHAETFEHTADLGLRVMGRDLPDLFEAAAAGLFDIIVANREAVRGDKDETAPASRPRPSRTSCSPGSTS